DQDHQHRRPADGAAALSGANARTETAATGRRFRFRLESGKVPPSLRLEGTAADVEPRRAQNLLVAGQLAARPPDFHAAGFLRFAEALAVERRHAKAPAHPLQRSVDQRGKAELPLQRLA